MMQLQNEYNKLLLQEQDRLAEKNFLLALACCGDTFELQEKEKRECRAAIR